MPELERRFTVTHSDFSKAGEVSIQVQGILKGIGFDPALIRRVAVCAYESEMNVVMHGGGGTVRLVVEPETLLLETEDDGPGIADIELAFKEGYSTATLEHREMGFGAGMGLPNIKRNADSVEIHSEDGKGTRLKMVFTVG